jgi:hypothetical protein
MQAAELPPVEFWAATAEAKAARAMAGAIVIFMACLNPDKSTGDKFPDDW